jgi:hypothetical protein
MNASNSASTSTVEQYLAPMSRGLSLSGARQQDEQLFEQYLAPMSRGLSLYERLKQRVHINRRAVPCPDE